MKKLAIFVTLLTMGCTGREIRAWQAWHNSDPEKADEFANRADIQAELGVRPLESPTEASQGTLPPLSPGTLPPISTIKRVIWDDLADCESGDRHVPGSANWAINTGNGFYGGVQFTLTSWRGVGGTGYPHQASRDEQIARAEMLLDLQGWGAWPDCSRWLGLR